MTNRDRLRYITTNNVTYTNHISVAQLLLRYFSIFFLSLQSTT